MKDFLSIALFTALVSSLYTAVAFILPQLEAHPPARLDKLPSDVPPENLVEMGEGVFDAVCVQCHKIGEPGGRGPDLEGAGPRAVERALARAEASGQEFTDVDYLLESLCKPGDYLVEGFGNIMPPQGNALDGGQMLATVAFLQSLGGTANVTATQTDVDRLSRFSCPTEVRGPGSGGDQKAGAAAAGSGEPVGAPEQVFTDFGCINCHAVDSPEKKQGPSLFDVGKRMQTGEIYEAILVPDAVIAEGFPKDIMKQMLDGNGFYQRMTPADYQALVAWLAEKKG